MDPRGSEEVGRERSRDGSAKKSAHRWVSAISLCLSWESEPPKCYLLSALDSLPKDLLLANTKEPQVHRRAGNLHQNEAVLIIIMIKKFQFPTDLNWLSKFDTAFSF